MCSQFVELIQIAHGIAFYLRYDPELLSPCLKCFEKLKSYIKLTLLEEGHKSSGRITNINNSGLI